MTGNGNREIRWVVLNMWAHTTGVVCWMTAVFMVAILVWFRRLPAPPLSDVGTWIVFAGTPLTCVAACTALRFKLPLVRVHLGAAALVVLLAVVGWLAGR